MASKKKKRTARPRASRSWDGPRPMKRSQLDTIKARLSSSADEYPSEVWLGHCRDLFDEVERLDFELRLARKRKG